MELCSASSGLSYKAQALYVCWQLLVRVQSCLQTCRTVDVVYSVGPELLWPRLCLLLNALNFFIFLNSLNGGISIEKPTLAKAPLWPF